MSENQNQFPIDDERPVSEQPSTNETEGAKPEAPSVQNVFYCGSEVQRDAEPPKKKRISLSRSSLILSAVALVLAVAMLTFTLTSAFYRERLTDDRLQNAVNGMEDGGSPIELFAAILEYYGYSDEYDEEAMMDEALRAYIRASGDRYAEYFNEEEYAMLLEQNAGQSQGIGVNVIQTQATYYGAVYEVIKIIAVTPDSPAEKAGVRVGDLIMWVGTEETEENLVNTLGNTMALSRLQGKAGTYAEFIALRPNGDAFEHKSFRILREKVEAVSVYSRISTDDPEVGIVKLTGFDAKTPVQFRTAMDSLIKDGCKSFVFDLRYNPGGNLYSIISILSGFLEKGDLILTAKDKQGNVEEYRAEPMSLTGDFAGCSVSTSDIGRYRGMKYAVLCNAATASAAELFTATFRDYELGQIIGEKTYGKGSMQSTIPLADFGYKGAIHLTVKMYFPPCGEGYDGEGIIPHKEVAMSEEALGYNVFELPDSMDAQLQAALDTLQ